MNPHSTPDPNPSSEDGIHADQSCNSNSDQSAAIPSVKQNVGHPLQAAQLSDKPHARSSDIVPLAGGETPQTPHKINDSTKSKSCQTKRQKNADNRVTVRFQNDVMEVLLARMELTGETLSEAVRNIVLESTQTGGGVILSPKTPPVQLEVLLGELGKWRKAFATAKPRLNIATPTEDDERYAQVIAWRKESKRLLQEIPQLEAVVELALAAVTNLTPISVHRFRKGLPLLERWKNSFLEKKQDFPVELIQDLIVILEDAGITTIK